MAYTDALKQLPYRVLIVDDVPENIEVLAAALAQECDVFFAVSGEEAMEAASSKRIDLIILDIMMPEVDGYEVCRLLKLEPHLAEIPVIFVTAKTDVADEAKGFAVGGVDYITKPITPLIVKARVRTHLQLKAIRDHLRALSDLDAVSGLPSRAAFDRMLEREVRRARLENESLTLLVLGLDDFDAFEALDGQLAVERALQKIGEALSRPSERVLDFYARFDWSQFALICPLTDAEQASELGRRLIDRVAALQIKRSGGQALTRLSASVSGVTVDFATHDPHVRVRPGDLVTTALGLLEQAERSGRSQIWLRRLYGSEG